MKTIKFIRKDKTIIHLDEQGSEYDRNTFKSINKAKKQSRQLQLQIDAKLGLGSLVVQK